MLVFSKTSVQGMRIGPANPRMLFFNDSVVVGTVKGGSMEVAAQDPERGMVFYYVDQNPARYRESSQKPKPASPFSRRADCGGGCHLSKSTGLPQLLLRSVTPNIYGVPVKQGGARDTDHRTPMSQLWGGWFVTGANQVPHMGNSVLNEGGRSLQIEPSGSSDIVALMVFEHQIHMMNLIARLGTEARTGGPARATIAEFTDYLLFVDEAPLAGNVSGMSGFAERFANSGPRDKQGRSLRHLDLNKRLMRYPCSYMIYSEAFQSLPMQVKEAVYRRMEEVLEHRSESDRRALREILRDTLPKNSVFIE
jgi:hypothetical protein